MIIFRVNIETGKIEKYIRNNDTITDNERTSNKIDDYDSILNKYASNIGINNSKKAKSINMSNVIFSFLSCCVVSIQN